MDCVLLWVLILKLLPLFHALFDLRFALLLQLLEFGFLRVLTAERAQAVAPTGPWLNAGSGGLRLLHDGNCA